MIPLRICGNQEARLGGVNSLSARLLVVGGTGFIGRNLVRRAVRQGYSTVVLSLNEPIAEQKIEGAEYFQADITDLYKLRVQLKNWGFEYIVNLSGYIDHCGFLEGGGNVIESHFLGVQNLLQTVEWSELKRFVQIGSSDEYGNLSAPQSEDMREEPISPYSFAKLASTQLLQMLYRTKKFPAVILRLFLVYGIGQDEKRFLPQIIRGCNSNAVFAVSAGEQLRDFCYIDDITDGIMRALVHDEVNGEVINLASGNPIAIRDVVNLVQKKIGQGSPDFGKVPYRIGENMILYADISKSKELLDWSPKIDIEKGISMIVDHYIEVTLS